MSGGGEHNASFATDGARESGERNICGEPPEPIVVEAPRSSAQSAELSSRDASQAQNHTSAQNHTPGRQQSESQSSGAGDAERSSQPQASFAQRPGRETPADPGAQSAELSGTSATDSGANRDQQEAAIETTGQKPDASGTGESDSERLREQAEEQYATIGEHLETLNEEVEAAAQHSLSELALRYEQIPRAARHILQERREQLEQQIEIEVDYFRRHTEQVDAVFVGMTLGQSNEDGEYRALPLEAVRAKWTEQKGYLSSFKDRLVGRWPGQKTRGSLYPGGFRAGADLLNPRIVSATLEEELEQNVEEFEGLPSDHPVIAVWKGAMKRSHQIVAEAVDPREAINGMIQLFDQVEAHQGDKTEVLNEALNPVSLLRDAFDGAVAAGKAGDWEGVGAHSVDFGVTLGEFAAGARALRMRAKGLKGGKGKNPKKREGTDLDDNKKDKNDQPNRDKDDQKAEQEHDGQQDHQDQNVSPDHDDSKNSSSPDSDSDIDADEGPPPENSTAATPEQRAKEDYAAALTSDYGGKFSEADFIKRYNKGQYFDLQARTWRKSDDDRLPDGISFDDAFDDLTHETVFGRYFGKLESSGLFGDRLRTILQQVGFAGRRRGDVRRDFRREVEPELMAYLTDEDSLRAEYKDLDWSKNDGKDALKQASHQRFLAFTEGLGGNDRGRLAEKWYRSVFAENSATQISIPAKLLNKLRGKPADHGRRIDMVDADGTLREIKHGSGKLSKRDLEQFEDYMLVLREEIALTDPRLSKPPVGKDSVQIKKAVFTFADPKGAKMNKDWIQDVVEDYPNLTVEVFDKHGKRWELTEVNIDTLPLIQFE